MIDAKTVETIAQLARLEFSEEEKALFVEQFAKIVAYVNAINKLELDKYEPLVNVLELTNVFREDEVQPSLPVEEALHNAPARNEMFFKVPKVLG